jgi:hypothetical protein
MDILGHQPSIAVIPASAYPFDNDDFAELVRQVSSVEGETGIMADHVQVRLGYLYGDAWPPDWTWITFVLDEGAQAVIDAVVAGVVLWGGRWLRRKREKDPRTRPIKAIIYAPDGTVLREVEVQEER